jgi:hypothetical protein
MPRQRKSTAKQSINPLPGSVQPQMVRCGKPWCRCSRGGPQHGPYYYRFYWDAGRQRKIYIPRSEVSQVQEAIRHWKQLHPPAYQLLTSIKELEELLNMLTQEA